MIAKIKCKIKRKCIFRLKIKRKIKRKRIFRLKIKRKIKRKILRLIFEAASCIIPVKGGNAA